MDTKSKPGPERHRSPIRFSLFTFLLVVTGIGAFLAYQSSHREARVETSFDLRSHLLRPRNSRSRTIEFLSRTKFLEPTGDVIVTQVLADPEVSGLMLVKGQADPAAWLKKNLVWQIDREREQLALSLTVPRGQQSQARKVFASVIRAFLQNTVVDESVAKELQSLGNGD